MADPVSLGLLAVSLAGTAMSAFGAVREGQAANESAKFEARQLEQQSKAQEAAGQRSALEQRRQSELMQSRALAVAGASGGGVTDPGVLRIISGIAGEGENAFQSELYNARTQAETSRSQAVARRFEGKQAKQAGVMKAASTALSGIAEAGTGYFGMSKAGMGVGAGGGGDFDNFTRSRSRNVNIPGM